MKQCPKCKSENFRKDGIVKKKQRYRCKEYNFRFTVEQVGKPNKLKRDALILYLEGSGFRSIGRILGVSNVTILKTKCYTKAAYMLVHSVKLLMFKWNYDLSILF